MLLEKIIKYIIYIFKNYVIKEFNKIQLNYILPYICNSYKIELNFKNEQYSKHKLKMSHQSRQEYQFVYTKQTIKKLEQNDQTRELVLSVSAVLNDLY